MAILFGVLAVAGCVFSLFAIVATRSYRRRVGPVCSTYPSVSILKPLYGLEPNLFDNLAGFCRQDYPAEVEIIFGVRDGSDPAAAIARQVIAAFPQVATRLVIDPRLHGQNGKISNLMNMQPSVTLEVVVLADSDMVVDCTYLRDVVDALSGPDVGLVTCLYRGLNVPGFWSQLSARGIDDHFLPNVIVGLTLGLAKPCFGSTIALRADTLLRIGGFATFKDVLADDNAMGQAVRGLGLRVAVPARPVLGHVCGSTTFAASFRQDLRWSRTIKSVDPAGFAGSIVTNPLPLAIIVIAIGGFGIVSGTLLMATLACRLALQVEIHQFTGVKVRSLWLGPLRDLVSFAVFIASFWPGSLDWRGHKFAVQSDGTMASTDSTGS
ncbi:bacteriohopanetetrol glucosamine biosynthesis glycosyltransferase HpnI [Lichenihabitans psoromatis]|uniref:bacteriohopanetetrol glucosamine biosynthesis glycosyltransferase HpnI n=1 Tax=Lichenihabitans psoromatis TaxID=2528642 RepID=UPI0013F156BF|nr:bacteriohopanetetrol glucosamine biosynthesis glycosyltransferase HpnI [Lichenihabitans psoromatis]